MSTGNVGLGGMKNEGLESRGGLKYEFKIIRKVVLVNSNN